MRQEFSMENFKRWVNEFIDGELEPYFRSAPIPTDEEMFEVSCKNRLTLLVLVLM